MNTDRIKEIHQKTAFHESQSVYVALMQVWNECAQEQGAEVGKAVAEERNRCKAFLKNEMTKMQVISEMVRDYSDKDTIDEDIFLLQSVIENLFPEPTEKGAAYQRTDTKEGGQ